MSKKPATVEQLEATNKVYILRDASKTDDDLVKMLGISKATFYTRLKVSNWKVSEIALIDLLCLK